MKLQYLFLCMSGLSSLSAGCAQDSDFDGVSDQLDQCPNTPQLKKIDTSFIYRAAVDPERLKPGNHAFPVDSRGCEFDNDKDGVVNSQDFCPDDSPEAISKGVASNGCPSQSDQDGTPDYRDKCPGTPAGIKTDASGCPLSNQTGVNPDLLDYIISPLNKAVKTPQNLATTPEK